ncbi:MAG: protein translocase subunit SecD, partial [Chthoniobacterales bacterium]
MSPTWTFLFGLFLLCLFAAYFLVEKEQTKRLLGTALTILLCAFCIYSFYPPSAKIHYGLDLQGGSSFLVRLVPPKDENGKPRAITPDMQQQAVEVIRRRVDQFGVSEPVITSQGSDRILVQIPGLDTAKIDEARAQLQRVAKLEFKLVNPQSGTLLPQIESGQTFTPPGYEILNGVKSSKTGQPEKYLVKKKPELTGAEVTRAQARFEQRGYEVDLSFNSEGGKTFARVTGQNIGNQLAIVLDGEVISAPVIQSEISNNSASITGNFTAQEAQDLASALQNPLQTPVVIDEVRSVSATLGQDSISRGLASGLAGLAATLIFVLIYYRTAGAVALIGLAVNGILLFGAMSLFGFVLTLPGIAGVILTIGMAIDANVLIYERLREEIGAGKSLKASIDTAYRKAFSAIFDANVTTLLKVVILFWLGSGPVKGFAITLTLGIIASMFSALLVTRNIFGWLIRFNLMKRISMLHLISSKHFDFLGKWKISVIASIVLLAASGIAFGVRGANMFNLDFTGGDSLVLRSDKPVDEAQVRSQLEKVGLGSAVIQQESSQRNQQTVHLIAIRAPYGSGQKILSELKASPQTSGLVVENSETVGPVMGSQLATTSLFALGIAFVGVMLYVAIRFEFSFSVGTIVAMFHDLIITLGIFVITGRQFSLVTIGAILTVAGYSINDKIVVFDRIREGLHSGRRGTIRSLMNDSINETLSRTVLTSGVTLICMLSLWIFGGPVLDDFAFTNVIGVIIGTYSSIFIAAPIVLWWTNLRKGNLRHEVVRPRT